MILNTARVAIANYIMETFTHIQIGTGTNLEDANQTALVTYYTEEKATKAYEETAKVKFTATFTFLGSATIQEALIAAGPERTNPMALSCKGFGKKVMEPGSSLTLNWTVAIVQG